MKKQSGFITTEFAVVMVWLAMICGWIANIVKLVNSDFDPLTGMVVARIIGVFVAPLGAVLGFL